MRILSVHNHYKHSAGEDTVFFAETSLLRKYGHEVEHFRVNNNHVNTIREKLEAALGVIYNIKSAQKFEEKLEEFQPDIIHVHNFFPLVSPAVFYVAQRYHIPVIMTLHNYRLLCPSAYLHYNGQVHMENLHKVFPLNAIKEKAYRNSYLQTASVILTTGVHKILGTWKTKVDRFIALTQGAADMFINSSLELDPQKVVIKPNFTIDLGLSNQERENSFLFVGRLSPEKGIETMLKANAIYPFKLTIIGDGPLRSMVEEHAAKHSNVKFIGYQERENVVMELKKAKALIFPSEWPEMFGMSIVEAFATGTPVIASNIGGGGYLVQDKHNGLHYTPGNELELVEQVKLFLQNEVMAKQFGQNARLTYEQEFTAEVNYKKLIRIYNNAIHEKRSPASNKAMLKAGF